MNFKEAYRPELLAEGAEGKSWEIVVIQPGWSLNGKYYPPDVLRAAVPLFEGLKVYAYRFGKALRDEFDHLPLAVEMQKPEGFAENLVGYFENVRYGNFPRREGGEGEGVLARFHVLEGADWLRKNLKDAWMRGRPEILGFSINAEGMARDAVIDGKSGKRVDAIKRIVSTEVVSEPAAGGEIVRLVASAKETEDMPEEKELKALLTLVESKLPKWMEGFTGAGEGEALDEYMLRVFEANAERAQAEMQAVPEEDKELLAEVARGVKSLNTVVELLRQGKVKEAMAILQNWVSVYPAMEKGTPEQRAKGFYSFPYAGAKGGYPGPGALRRYGAAPPARASDSKSEPKKEEERAMEEKAMKAKEKELAARESKLRIQERLAAAKLPDKARERVEKLLLAEGATTDEAIDKAVADEREYLASLSESGKPKGLGDAQDPPQVRVGDAPVDKLDKAFEGMFAGEDIDGVPRVTSLLRTFHETHRPRGYLSQDDLGFAILESIALGFPRSPNRPMEGHLDRLRGGWKTVPKTDLLREAVATGDWSVAFGQALYRRLQKAYRDDPLNDWRRIVSSIENLSDATNTYSIVRLGGYDVLPVVNQKAPYQELTDPTEATEVITPSKYGALAKFTWEDALADRLGVLRRIPIMLGRSAARTVSELVWDQIDTNPTMADTVALINAAHANHSTTPLAYAAVNTSIQKLQEQTEQDSGKKLGLNPAFLLVSPTKRQAATEITDSELQPSATGVPSTINVVRSLGVKTFTTLGLGRFSANAKYYWYVVASPRDAETIAVGFLGGRDRPDLFVQSPVDTPTSGAAFEADTISFKIRLVVGARVTDWRWIQGNLATS